MKKYMKLIGSLLIMMCMAAGIFFAVTDSEAAEETRLWLLPEGNTIHSDDPYYTVNEQGVPVYDGYLFAGYYVEATDGYAAIKSTEGMSEGTYYAKFVPKGVLGIKAQVSGNVLKNEVSDTAKNMIRFVTTIDDSLDYKKVGFKINVGGYADIDAEVDEYVFEKIYAVGAKEATQETYEPSIFDSASKYFKTWTFTDVPEGYLNTDITVTPYWVTLDGTPVYGTTSIRTANYCRGWFYVNSSAYAEGSANVGTYNSPATLETAVAIPVDTKLVTPVAYLQSDVTINETVNVTKTMTIESIDAAKTITYNNTTNNMIEVAENGNLTLNTLKLNGGNHVVYSSKGTVETNDVTIQNGAGYGYYLTGAKAILNNAQISGVQRGIQLYDSADVKGNVVTVIGPIAHGIACGSGSSFDITTLAISGNTSHAINVYGGSTATVTGGEIKESTAGNSVNVAASEVTLTDVDIAFASTATGVWEGIKAYKENNVAATIELYDVTITDAPEHGIQIWQESSVTGSEVTVTSPGTSGVLCADAGSNFNFTTLNIFDSGSHGIDLNDGASGTIINGTIEDSGSKGIYLHKNKVSGASIILTAVQINNSIAENLYLHNASTATINGMLTTKEGTYALAIYGGSTVMKGAQGGNVTLNFPNKYGVRIYDSGSKLDVDTLNVDDSTDDALVVASGTQVTITNAELTNCKQDGFYLNGGTVILKGTVNIDSPKSRGIRNDNNGTLSAADATINITSSGDISLSTSSAGKVTIGTLNITGAKGYSAVNVSNTAEVTINGGTIQTSQKHGVNANHTSKLNMTNCVIKDSGSINDGQTYYDIQNESGNAIITLTDVEYSTKNY